MEEIFILGVGHNSPVYIDLVEAIGYRVAGLYHYDDTRTGETDHGFPILGSFEDLFSLDLKGMNFALSMGDNGIRAQLYRKILDLGGNVPTLIHPTAQVSRFAKIGQGSVIHLNTVIHPDVVIGENTVVSYNSSIAHSTTISNNCYIAFGALVGAYVHMEDNVFVGIGANIISGKVKSIGSNSYIGAGALVTKDVPNNVVVAGSPARVIKELPSPPTVNNTYSFEAIATYLSKETSECMPEINAVKKQLVIIGARGMGRRAYNLFLECKEYLGDIECKGFLDSKKDALDNMPGYPPILSSVEDYVPEENDVFICALGDVHYKKMYSEMILSRGGEFITLIHPQTYIPMNVKIGKGCIICRCEMLCDVTIGDFVTILGEAVIGHDVQIGSWSHVGPLAFLGGFAQLGELVTMHSRASLLPHKKAGDESSIGASSLSIRNVPAKTTVFGVPATKI